MRLAKNWINRPLIFAVFFLTFLGFYTVLLLAINSGAGEFTRQVTIPMRLIISSSLVGLILLNLNNLRFNSYIKWFLLFSFFYLVRILSDFFLRESYYLSTSEVLFYFMSFSVLPFMTIVSYRFDLKSMSVIFNSILVSGLLFSLASFLAYGRFVGEVDRLATGTAGEEVISPLALSYCATLIVGVLITFLIYNRVGYWKKVVVLLIISLSIVPFFLGASRGSLIALFIPFLMMIFSGKSFRFILNLTVSLIFLGVGLYYLDTELGSGLLSRFFGMADAVKEGSATASRLEIWETSFNQFQNNPWIGDKLRVGNYASYPHNLFLEVLQTMGVAGFIPFVILLFAGIRSSFTIFKHHEQFSWVAVIFLQAMIQNMFSGSIYTASWLWTSLALVLTFNSLNRKSSISNGY